MIKKPVDIKKVVVIGPECTGKSDLSEYLANEFNTVWVNEYAREYLDHLSRPYGPEDLLRIAQGQLALEDAHALSLVETDAGVAHREADAIVIRGAHR